MPARAVHAKFDVDGGCAVWSWWAGVDVGRVLMSFVLHNIAFQRGLAAGLWVSVVILLCIPITCRNLKTFLVVVIRTGRSEWNPIDYTAT